MLAWEKFSDKVEGKLVEGDKTAPPTKWWNFHWLLLFGWKNVVIFKVSQEAAERGYHVGFRPLIGEAQFHFVTCHSRSFKMSLGHEDCTFFAIDDKGHEIPIELLTIGNKNTYQYSGAEQF
ncbi:MAG: hypothetical protein WC750_04955 [Patescibacteria group bacterium]|jgi:hypothetical protein